MGNQKLCFNWICSPLVCYYVCNGESWLLRICSMWKFWLQTLISANIFALATSCTFESKRGWKGSFIYLGPFHVFWFGQHPTFPHQPATNQCLCSVDIFGFAASKQGEAFILVVHQTEDASLLVPVAASSIEETGPHPTSPISSSHPITALSSRPLHIWWINFDCLHVSSFFPSFSTTLSFMCLHHPVSELRSQS